MDDFRHLEFTRVMPRRDGIFAYTPFPGWHHKYEFFIPSQGEVQGKAGSGLWLELTQELSSFVAEQVKSILGQNTELLYI